MPRFPKLSNASIQKIARSLSGRLPFKAIELYSYGQGIEIAESCPVFTISLEDLRKAGVKLINSARDTGDWHHQLWQSGVATQYARSSAGLDGDDWSVHSVGPSNLAYKFAEAVSWIDNNVHGDDITFLLTLPYYLIHAFWLRPDSSDIGQVIIIDKPFENRTLKYQLVYNEVEFIKLLSSESVIRGLPPRPISR